MSMVYKRYFVKKIKKIYKKNFYIEKKLKKNLKIIYRKKIKKN